MIIWRRDVMLMDMPVVGESAFTDFQESSLTVRWTKSMVFFPPMFRFSALVGVAPGLEPLGDASEKNFCSAICAITALFRFWL